jgi:hypothetical protein
MNISINAEPGCADPGPEVISLSASKPLRQEQDHAGRTDRRIVSDRVVHRRLIALRRA